MRNKTYLIILLGLSFLFCSCATLPPVLEKPIEKTKVFQASYDDTWKAMIQVFSSGNEFVTVAQKESGLITLQKSITPGLVDKYALAPSGMIWEKADANISVNASLDPQDKSKIKVTINTRFIASGRDSGEVFWFGQAAPLHQMELGSRGIIEKEYFDKIEALLPGKTYKWLEGTEEKK